jgi:hypothetical protein
MALIYVGQFKKALYLVVSAIPPALPPALVCEPRIHILALQQPKTALFSNNAAEYF